MTAALLAILLLAVAAPQAPTVPLLTLASEPGAWVVRIETTGGFTGRGLGSYTASSSGELHCLSLTLESTCPARLAPAAQGSLSSLVAAIPVSTGAVSTDISPRGSLVCNDCVTTTMTVRERDGDGERTLTYRWDESTLGTVPGDVRRLHDAVVALASPRAR